MQSLNKIKLPVLVRNGTSQMHLLYNDVRLFHFTFAVFLSTIMQSCPYLVGHWHKDFYFIFVPVYWNIHIIVI